MAASYRDELARIMRQPPSSFAARTSSREAIDRVNRETSERNRARRRALAVSALVDPRD